MFRNIWNWVEGRDLDYAAIFFIGTIFGLTILFSVLYFAGEFL